MRGAQRKGNIYISLFQTGDANRFSKTQAPLLLSNIFKSAVGQRE